MIKHIQELQRRLDYTLGKPSSFYKKKQSKPMNLASRLSRMESQNLHMNEKLEDIFKVLTVLATQDNSSWKPGPFANTV